MREVGRWFQAIRHGAQHVSGVLTDLATQALAMPDGLRMVIVTIPNAQAGALEMVTTTRLLWCSDDNGPTMNFAPIDAVLSGKGR